MFTDVEVTPVRLEILLDVLRDARGAAMGKNTLYASLQPEPLAAHRRLSGAVFSAARELELAEERGDKVALTDAARKTDSAAAIRGAFDRVVFTGTAVEPHFALFFAYLLGLGRSVHAKRAKSQAWVDEYTKAVTDLPATPFNEYGVSGFRRWADYVGLGWFDSADSFQPLPVERLGRALPAIFGKTRTLSSEQFMTRLAAQCPELDGGELFVRANPAWDGATTKVCTLGLSHALNELEHAGVLRFRRPADSSGWSIAPAEPRLEPDPDRAGARFTTVEYLVA